MVSLAKAGSHGGLASYLDRIGVVDTVYPGSACLEAHQAQDGEPATNIDDDVARAHRKRNGLAKMFKPHRIGYVTQVLIEDRTQDTQRSLVEAERSTVAGAG